MQFTYLYDYEFHASENLPAGSGRHGFGHMQYEKMDLKWKVSMVQMC